MAMFFQKNGIDLLKFASLTLQLGHLNLAHL